jgi:hypothetical protein
MPASLKANTLRGDANPLRAAESEDQLHRIIGGVQFLLYPRAPSSLS